MSLECLIKHYCTIVEGDLPSRYDAAYGLHQVHKYGQAENNKLFVALYLPLAFMGRYDDDEVFLFNFFFSLSSISNFTF